MFHIFKKSTEKNKSIDLKNPDAIALVTNVRHSENPFGNNYSGSCLIKENHLTSACFQTIGENEICYKQQSPCYVSFITPHLYPNTLWVGREIELYEGKLLVGTMTIKEIKNRVLDRNVKFKDHQDVLSDVKALNIALKRSLEWGEKFEIPLDNKLMKSLPYLSGNDIEKLSTYILEVQDDVIWKIYCPNWDAKSEKLLVDCKKITVNKYPWINKHNLASLESQGMYYAWHG